jgi:DedD protein
MMERALKERIIGAAVLVVLAVLIVPVFLDGPPQEGEVVTERVLLPGQEMQKTQTVVLDRDRTEPVPSAAQAEPEPEPIESKPAPAASEPEPKPVASKPAPSQSEAEPVASKLAPTESKPTPGMTAAASTTGMWAVQLGSFSNKENAEKLAADLRKQGYAAFLSQLQTANGVMHRVRIGPQKDRESAEAMAARLAKVGHDGKVVPHP